LQDILTDVNSVIYVDTDVLFLRPIQDLWSLFGNFSEEQIVFYIVFYKTTQNLGVNSGVMMMNLTRMREFRWTQRMWPIYKQYQHDLTWGDQDIINIVFAGNPDKLFVFDCAWNYRPDHCMYMSVCKRAKLDGAFIVHGSRGYSHSEKQPPFRILYEAFQRFRPAKDDLSTHLVQPLHDELAGLDASKSNCAKVFNVFLKQLMTRTKKQF
jgi:UDP-xylose:glucoside alpha-1,3-xylosyltransferase